MEPKKSNGTLYKSQVRYTFHPHEFRDVFKSCASLSGVSPIASEYFLGHSLDQYNYDKSPMMDVEFFRKEYEKMEMLNILSTGANSLEMRKQAERIMLLEDQLREAQETIKELERAVGFYKGHRFDEMMYPALTNGTYEVRTARNEEELDD